VSKLFRARPQDAVVERWRRQLTLFELLFTQRFALCHTFVLLGLPVVLVGGLPNLHNVTDRIRQRGEARLAHNQCVWPIQAFLFGQLAIHRSLVTID